VPGVRSRSRLGTSSPFDFCSIKRNNRHIGICAFYCDNNMNKIEKNKKPKKKDWPFKPIEISKEMVDNARSKLGSIIGEEISDQKAGRAEARSGIIAAYALELRLQGKTYQEIADACGYKQSVSAHNIVKNALKHVNYDSAKRLCKLELARLDKMAEGVWSGATSGDVKSINAMLKIMERRSRLMGLDKPVKVAPTNIKGDKPYLQDAREKLASQLFVTIERNRGQGSGLKAIADRSSGVDLRLDAASEGQSDSSES